MCIRDRDTLDQHVVSQDDTLAADLQHRRIVLQAASGRVGGQRPEAVDEGAFAAQLRTALPTPSSTPLTKFASVRSKKAWATSTYSLIALPSGTSGRASSS